MKKAFTIFSLIVIVALAGCTPAVMTTSTEIPTAEPTAPVVEPTPGMPKFEGIVVQYGVLNLVIPQGLAAGFIGYQDERVEGGDNPQSAIAPEHISIALDAYPLADRKHRPQIFVYPATDYGMMNPAAFEAIHRLRNIFADPAAALGVDQLPNPPFFNSVQTFAGAVQPINFHGGQGVRFVTQTNQGIVPANNQELYYHFEGISDVGDWYIIAILPIAHPQLAETGEYSAIVPAGGIPFPDLSVPGTTLQDYNAAVAALLSGAAPESFTPVLSLLDQLVQSIEIIP